MPTDLDEVSAMVRQLLSRAEFSLELGHHCVQALNEQAATEGTGLSIAIELSRSAFLTQEERDFAEDVLRPDEVAHLKWCRSAANHIAGSAKPGYGAWQRRCNQALWDAIPSTNREGLPRDHMILFHLRQIERLLLRRFDYYEQIINSILPEEFSRGLDRLKLDEARHIKWGKSVSNRLSLERAVDLVGAKVHLSMRNTTAHRASKEYKAVVTLMNNVNRV